MLWCADCRISCLEQTWYFQVVSFVRSFFVSVNCGCMCKLRSSSHHVVALPRLMSPCSNERSVFVQRPSWCSAIIPACFQDVLLCPRIHDRITTAANKSSALWVARTIFCKRMAPIRILNGLVVLGRKMELLSATWLLSSFSKGSCGLASVVPSSDTISLSRGSSSTASSTFADYAAAELFWDFLFVCVTILIIRRLCFPEILLYLISHRPRS